MAIETKTKDVNIIEERIPWHPAFFEAIQKELEEYKDILEFESEHPLTEEPLRMDVLIIKKRQDAVIEKNIAAIFRANNIIEYKSPNDYASVDDLHKLYAYVYLYVSLNKLSIMDVSLTIVETVRPKKLIRYFKETRGFSIDEVSGGIYVVSGDAFPIQIIESKKLSASDNFWLKSLNKNLSEADLSSILGEHLEEIKESNLNAYVYAIFHANQTILKEKVTNMGVQNRELKPLEDVFDEMIAEGYFKGIMEKYEKIHVDETKIETKRETKIEVAKEMFKEGDSLAKIAKVTKLPMDVLSEALQTQLSQSDVKSGR
jgi:hypothetical protein